MPCHRSRRSHLVPLRWTAALGAMAGLALLTPLPAQAQTNAAQMKKDAAELRAAAARIDELGNRSKWIMSGTTSKSIGKNAPWIQGILE